MDLERVGSRIAAALATLTLLGPIVIGLLKAVVDTVAECPNWQWEDDGAGVAAGD